MSDPLAAFREIWLADFEFHAPPGERPLPLCLVAREFRSGRLIRHWFDGQDFPAAPFAVGRDALFVAYYASAELGCFLALDWPMPTNVLDLFCEFRRVSNGMKSPAGNGLLGALAWHGLPAIDAMEKEGMRELAIRGGPFADTEQSGLLDYCQSDVDALAKLFAAMLPRLDERRALLRGKYMKAVAHMEHTGVPLDVETFERLRDNWQAIQLRLIDEVDREYGVYPPTAVPVDPDTPFGAAVYATAGQWGIDPYRLAVAAEHVWQEKRGAVEEHTNAVRKARQLTGLTVSRIDRLENRGHDASTCPGLDVKARELAREFPALGIGTGYREGERDDADYAGGLWQLLREPGRLLRKHDAEILERAAELVAESPDAPSDWQRSFNAKAFARWLGHRGIPWLKDDAGRLKLDDDSFKQMARLYPMVSQLRELRHALSELRLNSLAVGSDGRNRLLLSVFASRTGRNQPSNAKYIFGPSVWLRGLIRPQPGWAVAYVDWSKQEFAIAAALSGDPAMMDAYTSGDPYLTFAKQAGAVPADATKESHKAERERFKVCALAVQYGMGERSLSQSLGQPEIVARELLRLHQQTYPKFWRWSQAAIDHAQLRGYLETVFGWRIRVGHDVNPRSLANFPCQANGAEMLRLACCLLTEAGVKVCAPIHDALLVEGTDAEIEAVVAKTQALMAEAGRIVLGGFELRSDAKIVRHPDRYSDPRGDESWGRIMAILGEIDRENMERDDPPNMERDGPLHGTARATCLLTS
ncbi:MAG: DNA polymerase [Pirellulales bacterium]